jgi:hypothetical protein
MSSTDDLTGYDETDFRAYHREGIWLTADYEEIPVAELETSHLLNIIKRMIRDCARSVSPNASFEWWLSVEAFWPFAVAELQKRLPHAEYVINEYIKLQGVSYQITLAPAAPGKETTER